MLLIRIFGGDQSIDVNLHRRIFHKTQPLPTDPALPFQGQEGRAPRGFRSVAVSPSCGSTGLRKLADRLAANFSMRPLPNR